MPQGLYAKIAAFTGSYFTENAINKINKVL